MVFTTLAALAPRRRPHRRGRGIATAIVIALIAGVSLIGAPAAYGQPFNPFTNCRTAPEPEYPAEGLVSLIDPPYASRGGMPDSVRREVHYGGLVWHTYDTGCTPNPLVDFDTWMGNQIFNVAKAIVGATTFIHYEVAQAGDYTFDDFDTIVRDGVMAMWNSVYIRWVGLALVLLAIMVLFWSFNGNIAKQVQYVALGLVALTAAGAVYLAPETWSSAFDEILMDGTQEIVEGFYTGPDDNSPEDVIPTILHDTIIYDNWVRGEFGATDAVLPGGADARTFGRELLRAQAITVNEVIDASGNPDYDYLGRIDDKKEQFTTIADQIKEWSVYDNFKGTGGSRIGIGVLAVLQALCLCIFHLAAKAMLFISLLIIRLVVVAMPAAAVIAIVQPAILRSILRVVGVAVVNGLFLAALAGLHGLILSNLFPIGAEPSGGLMWAMLLTLFVSAIFWAIARPIKRIVAMARLVGGQIGLERDPNSGVRRELRRQRRRAWRNLRKPMPDSERWWNLPGNGDNDGGTDSPPDNNSTGGHHQRPEETAGTGLATVPGHNRRDETVYATATRVRPHGGREPNPPLGAGPHRLPAGTGEVPSSGRVWRQDPPARPGITGTPTRRAIGTGSPPNSTATDSTQPSAGPSSSPTPPPTPAAGPGDSTSQPPGPGADARPDTRTSGGPGRDTGQRHDPPRGPIFDSDQQAVVYDRQEQPDLRPADMYTDAAGQQVYMIYDPDSGGLRRDDLPPPSTAGGVDGGAG